VTERTLTTPPNPSGPSESEHRPPHHPGTYGYPPAPRSNNGFAIASLVLGIVGVVFTPLSLAFLLFASPGVLALVFGYIARNQIKKHGQYGAGLATAGIILGWVAVGLYLIFNIIFLII
jgi:Domain of unknown function (DUF4190)